MFKPPFYLRASIAFWLKLFPRLEFVAQAIFSTGFLAQAISIARQSGRKQTTPPYV